MIEDLEEETGAPTARAVRASLSACYSRALERSRLPDTFSSPVVKAYRPQGRRSRERVLTPDELRLIWRAIITYGETFGPIAQLLLLTGQRREEIGGLARAELDLTNNRLDFPSSRTKNNLPHLVPLAEPALEILRAWDRDAADDDRERLFGRGEGGFSGWSKAMTRLHIRIARARAERVGDTIEIPAEIQARLDDEENRDKRLDLLAEAHRPWMLPHWTLHDLRRTLITQANEYSLAAPHIIEVFVNHISGPVKAKATVAGVYNRAIYLQQREKFARRWADWLMSVVL